MRKQEDDDMSIPVFFLVVPWIIVLLTFAYVAYHL